MKSRIIILLVLGIYLISIASASTFCCEKTNGANPAYCQNVNSESQCQTGDVCGPQNDQPCQKTPASCDATSYCQPGTCINGQEGICMPNTPQIVCEANYGSWNSAPKAEIDQCKLGCCLIGDQAAFTTQVACNRMSEIYGKAVSYSGSINNELSCLATANPSTEGACVFTKNFLKTCEMTTKKECTDKAKSASLSDVQFHSGYLCTAPTLGTNCAKTENTACDDKFDVRFIDSCGNLANIYDSSKLDDINNYWTYIQDPSCTDRNGQVGNKNSPNCGDCDFLAGGSMCKQKKIGESVDTGNNICKDLDCKGYTGSYSGSFPYPKHGETWCATDSTTGKDSSPGATYFRLMCYNGEVTSEECGTPDSTRQEVCIEKEDATSKFMNANCKVNIWESCASQNNSADCLDGNLRDCRWVDSAIQGSAYYFSSNGLSNNSNDKAPEGACVPFYPPGFERDGKNNVVGGDFCSMANAVCHVKYERGGLGFVGGAGLFSKYKCTENCSCLDDSWESGLNSICTSLGDCGNKVNYIGSQGKQYSDTIKIITDDDTEA